MMTYRILQRCCCCSSVCLILFLAVKSLSSWSFGMRGTSGTTEYPAMIAGTQHTSRAARAQNQPTCMFAMCAGIAVAVFLHQTDGSSSVSLCILLVILASLLL